MVSFIDDQQIPTSLRGLLRTLWRLRQITHTSHNQCAFGKGIRRILMQFHRFTMSFIHHAESQIELAQHFHEPLMHQGFWHQNQNALGTSGAVEGDAELVQLRWFFPGQLHPPIKPADADVPSLHEQSPVDVESAPHGHRQSLALAMPAFEPADTMLPVVIHRPRPRPPDPPASVLPAC